MEYFIYAYPASYGGNHGMYNYDLIDCYNYEEAMSIATEMARDVIWNYRPDELLYTRDDYCQEMGYDEWINEYKEDYQSVLDEYVEEEIDFSIYELQDGITIEDYKEWVIGNMPPEDFIENFCKTATETVLNNI